jgi:uncharacterized SAM-binding protein YcdF (DUF218 family)
VSRLARGRALVGRVPIVRLIEGGAIGIALWCILFAFQLLPSKMADTPGVLLFMIVGMAIRASPMGGWLLAVLALGAAAVLVVSETSISNTVASRWIRRDQLPDSAVGAIVVLSASLNPNTTISGEALDHLLTGLELLRAGKARLLVTTTVQQQFPTGFVSSDVDQQRVVSLFGGENRWMRTAPGRSTRDEAVESARLLLSRGIRRIAVVASPMHTRRACAAFEAVGFDVTCVPARMRNPGGEDPGPWPADRLTVFGQWVYEVAATVNYRRQGWLGPGPPDRRN